MNSWYVTQVRQVHDRNVDFIFTTSNGKIVHWNYLFFSLFLKNVLENKFHFEQNDIQISIKHYQIITLYRCCCCCGCCCCCFCCCCSYVKFNLSNKNMWDHLMFRKEASKILLLCGSLLTIVTFSLFLTHFGNIL